VQENVNTFEGKLKHQKSGSFYEHKKKYFSQNTTDIFTMNSIIPF
jgi:hypothetical protein